MVDDEPAIRALIAKIVERAGFPVGTARDGAEALEPQSDMHGSAAYRAARCAIGTAA